MALTFGSLFSGIGGFDLGFERAGMQCAWQVEIDAKARQVLDKHWPNVPKVEDVRDVRAGTVSAVDVICGGFPCQDVSVAGRRAGLAGDRSGLWFEFHRILDELHPRWTVIENVPGLLSSNGGADFAVILSGLVECGYRVCWRVLDAQYFGLAQRRRRVFIVGSLGDGTSAQILLESEGGTGHPEAGEEARADIARTLTSGSGSPRFDPNGEEFIVNALTGFNGGGADDNSAQGNDLVAVDLQQITSNVNRSRPKPESPPLTTNGQVVAFRWYAASSVGMSMSEGISPTLQVSGDNTHAVHTSVGVRRLTPLECERLQGFPDGWTDGQADGPRYRQLGNAIAVSVAEWIGRRIVALEESCTP